MLPELLVRIWLFWLMGHVCDCDVLEVEIFIVQADVLVVVDVLGGGM